MKKTRAIRGLVRPLAALLAASAIASGCATLPGTGSPQNHVYLIDAVPPPGEAGARVDRVLVVSPPQAQPGYDTEQMMYMTREHELGAFARSRWAQAPARMIGPLLVRALQQSGRFDTVVAGPTATTGDLRLETEVVRLQHEFLEKPSRVRLVLRAALLDAKTAEVVASRRFEETETAPLDTPYGGVVATNRLVARVLEQVARYVADAVLEAPASGQRVTR